MFFVVSTGRSGSTTIANVLSQSPTALCVHEPTPRLIAEAARYRYGEIGGERINDLLRESRRATIDGLIYGESANRTALVIPELATAFPEARFVWLVRNGRFVVSSAFDRGWFDPVRLADSDWERWRLRGDKLGLVDPATWAQWTPFRRCCWLWSYTNSLIRSDLGALDPSRSRCLRLEDIETGLDAVAHFVGIEPVAWSVTRQNERAEEASDNPRFGPAMWSDEQHADFEVECGDLMDELYPGWRATKADSDPQRPEDGDRLEADPLTAIRTDLAGLKVIRGELNRLVWSQAREERSRRGRDDRINDVSAHLAQLTSDVEQLRSTLEQRDVELRAEVDRLRTAEERATHKLAETRASTSFRVGNTLMRAARAATRAPKRIRLSLDASGVRTAARDLARNLARSDQVRSAVEAMPARPQEMIVALGERLVVSVPASSAPRAAGGRGYARRSHRRDHLGVRVAVDPALGPAYFTAGVDAVQLVEGVGDAAPPPVDIGLMAAPPHGLVVDHHHGSTSGALDAPTVTIGSGQHQLQVVAPLPRGLTPMGFHRDTGEHYVSVSTGCVEPDVLPNVPPGRRIEVIHADALPHPHREPDRFRERLQPHLALVDSPALHADRADRAALLACVAAIGLPVVAVGVEELDGWLPPEVLDTFDTSDPRLVLDRNRRELTSHRQRNAVHARLSERVFWDAALRHGGRRGVRRRTLTVTVATKRPAMIDRWAPLVATQTLPADEVVVVFHGSAFDETHEAQAREHLGDRLAVVQVGDDVMLGDAMNAGLERAGGDLIVKWDDDDLYGPGHLGDLLRAYEYSGADLVGKAAEFGYLAGLDVTVRRMKSSTEAFSPTICGATLTIARSELREMGGWRRAPRRIDSLLIEDVRAAGGSTYRTSGLGFIFTRAARSDISHHTWSADEAYFLDGAVDQRRGLDTGFAGLDLADHVREQLR